MAALLKKGLQTLAMFTFNNFVTLTSSMKSMPFSAMARTRTHTIAELQPMTNDMHTISDPSDKLCLHLPGAIRQVEVLLAD